MYVTASGARTRTPLCLALFCVLAACPQVIRDPSPTPPAEGCAPRATTCHEGHPWVCGPDGKWSLADRRCDLFGARCCMTESPYGRRLHACAPSDRCLDDDALASDGGAR